MDLITYAGKYFLFIYDQILLIDPLGKSQDDQQPISWSIFSRNTQIFPDQAGVVLMPTFSSVHGGTLGCHDDNHRCYQWT